jgi:hypothetical protein
MDPWRIALLAAVGIFVIFLLLKMRPRLDEDAEREETLEPLTTRAERGVWRRLRKLPLVSQERILARLDQTLEHGDIPSGDGHSLDGDSLPGDSLSGDSGPGRSGSGRSGPGLSGPGDSQPEERGGA